MRAEVRQLGAEEQTTTTTATRRKTNGSEGRECLMCCCFKVVSPPPSLSLALLALPVKEHETKTTKGERERESESEGIERRTKLGCCPFPFLRTPSPPQLFSPSSLPFLSVVVMHGFTHMDLDGQVQVKEMDCRAHTCVLCRCASGEVRRWNFIERHGDFTKTWENRSIWGGKQ